MTAVAKYNDHITAAIEVLRATGMDVGDGEKPDGASLPYLVVYPYTTVEATGPVSDQHADVASEVLVHAVGETRASAGIAADRGRVALLSGALEVPDRVVTQVTNPVSQPGQRDDDISPPLFYCVDVYAITTTPAT